VHRENLFVNDGCDRQAVETIRKSLPKFDIVPAFTCKNASASENEQFLARGQTRGKGLTFIIKAVNPIDTGALMVST
jgi:hypothetical protein